MDLFQLHSPTDLDKSIPLAARMAPRHWGEFIGQDHLTVSSSLLRRSIDSDRLQSSIFFGPPGTGKTALARMAAKKSNAAIEYINAVTAGVSDIRFVVKRALERKRASGQKTLLVIDEIHHFNRSQQDALLPDVERGTLIMIGLTTENPSFYVNSALLSRSTIFEFKSLTDAELSHLIDNVLSDKERGLGNTKITIEEEARLFLVRSAEGDARRLLNSLDLATAPLSLDQESTQNFTLDMETIRACTQKKSIHYDKKSDEHYDTISAFIKSLRGSDPDAALYWMVKMLSAGEDPRFVARRLLIFSSEDVGNADPQAIQVANSVADVVERIGMPEARIPLAQAVTYLACAPKSNASYLALGKAQGALEKEKIRDVPIHLKDSSRDGKKLGHGVGYLYPHDFPHHHVKQIYLPKRMNFYEPSEEGYEREIKRRLDEWRKNNPSE